MAYAISGTSQQIQIHADIGLSDNGRSWFPDRNGLREYSNHYIKLTLTRDSPRGLTAFLPIYSSRTA